METLATQATFPVNSFDFLSIVFGINFLEQRMDDRVKESKILSKKKKIILNLTYKS